MLDLHVAISSVSANKLKEAGIFDLPALFLIALDMLERKKAILVPTGDNGKAGTKGGYRQWD